METNIYYVISKHLVTFLSAAEWLSTGGFAEEHISSIAGKDITTFSFLTAQPYMQVRVTAILVVCFWLQVNSSHRSLSVFREVSCSYV